MKIDNEISEENKMKENEKKLDEQSKKEIVDFYVKSSQKILTRGKIKKETLDKIMEEINADCRKKK